MLSIIIVNYCSAHLIIDCLQSLYCYNIELSFEVIIVDNNSNDGSKELILQQYPSVEWIQMNYNTGFARANNAGIRIAQSDVFLLLNPDTIAIDNSIELCYQKLINSNYVAAGVQLLNEDGSFQTSGSFFVKGGLNHLLPLPFWGAFIRWLGYRAKFKIPGIMKAKEIEEIDWINGAFLMVKKTAIEKTGLLDEDFFLYAEEIEWCSRLRKYGPLCIYGNLQLIHLQGETANEAFASSGKNYFNLYDRKGRQIMLSNFVRIRKQFGAGWFLIHLFFYVFEIPFLLGIVIFQKITARQRRYNFSEFRGYIRNVIYLLKKSGTIFKNKPHFYKAL